MKIVIDTEGNVHAVYDDRLTNLNLGPQEVKRVTNVEFDPTSQLWKASLPDGSSLNGKVRGEVLHKEHQWVEQNLVETLT